MKNNMISRTLVRSAVRAAIKDPDKNIPRISNSWHTAPEEISERQISWELTGK